ncbi:MAG: peptide MFS transporter [Planctomycetes bacterium]|nr:peptide MFS transporter [Planctomycetota bacterium]
MSTPTATGQQRTFLGHPIGLYVLFFTEMWERFSYYGMRALLMLYMVNYFRWTQKDASTVYKVYTSFVYVTPILGGYLADRYLGNRRAVIIGAVLMAIGHFLMAFEELEIFMGALVFLILGNGFFKPNMSTQVGRLYAANDGRRDGGYTIFYMGINLGAFLSPLMCGWLQENTVGGYHSGFTLAGIGMVLGLGIYLLGQPFIKELPPDALIEKSAGPIQGTEIQHQATVPLSGPPADALTETQAERAPSVLGSLAGAVPGFLYLVGGLVLGASLIILAILLLGNLESLAPTLGSIQESLGGGDVSNVSNMILLAIAGFCLGLLGYVAGRVTGGVRDRVLAILTLGIFVVFFWAAFEQAGNVLNIWADQSTNRFITQEAIPPKAVEEFKEDKGKKRDDAPVRAGFVQHFLNLFPNMVRMKERQADQADPQPPDQSWGERLVAWFNPMPTVWFQSINALAIFLIAPIFAWLWIYLDRRGMQPSIPFKMVLGLVFMSLSMAVMLGAAREENRVTEAPWKGPLPAGIEMTATHQLAHGKASQLEPFHAGRLVRNGDTLVLHGVLDKNQCDLLVEKTSPETFQKKIEELRKKSEGIDGEKVTSVTVELTEVPPGFDMKFSGLKKSVVEFRDERGTACLIAHARLVQKEVKGLLAAGGQPAFRTTVHQLYVDSAQFRVSSWWLFWSYILATLGELCLSPVGLSMVSKLAPAKFATMLMGVWLLTTAFGNFVAGSMGEIWGTIPPTDFFILAAAVVGGAALILLILVRFVTSAMHGVN